MAGKDPPPAATPAAEPALEAAAPPPAALLDRAHARLAHLVLTEVEGFDPNADDKDQLSGERRARRLGALGRAVTLIRQAGSKPAPPAAAPAAASDTDPQPTAPAMSERARPAQPAPAKAPRAAVVNEVDDGLDALTDAEIDALFDDRLLRFVRNHAPGSVASGPGHGGEAGLLPQLAGPGGAWAAS